jgi:hypothetical protein
LDERTLSVSLTAGVLVLLLAFSTWHGAWWRSKPATAMPAKPAKFVPTDTFAVNPFAAKSELLPTPGPPAAPEVADGNSQRAVVPAQPQQSEPSVEDAVAEVDYEQQIMERNRVHGRGARTH